MMTMPAPARPYPLAASATLFAAAAAALRWLAQDYMETRYLFLMFATLAAGVEFAGHRRGIRANLHRFGGNLFAAALALLAVKWSIEGINPHVVHLWKSIP